MTSECMSSTDIDLMIISKTFYPLLVLHIQLLLLFPLAFTRSKSKAFATESIVKLKSVMADICNILSRIDRRNLVIHFSSKNLNVRTDINHFELLPFASFS